MNLYKIERQDRGGYDTFDMAVVAAESEYEARCTSPNGWQIWTSDKGWVRRSTGEPENHGSGYGWTSPESVTVTKIGKALAGTVAGVVVASFNAG